jgi:hypothetical protein
LAAQKKKDKDAAKKHQVHKALEQEALKRHRRQQRLDGLPLEESPSKTVSGEDDDSGDDDAWSRYDTVASLAHLPNVRPFLEPIGGSTSQASREAPAPVEGEGELGERRVGAGPAARAAASSGTVAEPPNYDGPHVPVIVIMTSDSRTYVPYNLKGLLSSKQDLITTVYSKYHQSKVAEVLQ